MGTALGDFRCELWCGTALVLNFAAHNFCLTWKASGFLQQTRNQRQELGGGGKRFCHPRGAV